VLQKCLADCISLHLIEIEHCRYWRYCTRNVAGIVVIKLQIAGRKYIRIGQDDASFNGMSQRADIARPVIVDERFFCGLRERLDVLAILARVDFGVVICDRQDIGSAFTQRRYGYFDGVQPE